MSLWLLALAWCAFAASFLLPASSSSEMVVLTEGTQAFASHTVVHLGWENFLRAMKALSSFSEPSAITWLGNLVLPCAFARLALRTRRRWPDVALTALFVFGWACVLIPGEQLLVGCWLWLASQALAVFAVWRLR